MQCWNHDIPATFTRHIWCTIWYHSICSLYIYMFLGVLSDFSRTESQTEFNLNRMTPGQNPSDRSLADRILPGIWQNSPSIIKTFICYWTVYRSYLWAGEWACNQTSVRLDGRTSIKNGRLALWARMRTDGQAGWWADGLMTRRSSQWVGRWMSGRASGGGRTTPFGQNPPAQTSPGQNPQIEHPAWFWLGLPMDITPSLENWWAWW